MKVRRAVSSLLALAIAGCASTDRMVRMSGGVFDEYSAPKSSRIRSSKYQKVSRELASSTRSNREGVAGMDDTLVNIWPFFFRSNAYWTILWPLVDKDPYGFAFRPIYNHEGDDYSILFPLTAWNPAAGHGWVTLFAWKRSGFGLIPLTWQWKEGKTGGAYYTPLFVYNYDEEPLHYTVHTLNRTYATSKWSRTDRSLFCFLALDEKRTSVESGSWAWLYGNGYPEIKNEWNYRFDGKKPFPENQTAFENYRAEIFRTLPRLETRERGLIPFWINTTRSNGDYKNLVLLLTRWEQSGKDFKWDLIFGPLLARYEDEYTENSRYEAGERSFTSVLLCSHFSTQRHYERTETWKKLNALDQLAWGESFRQRKPAIEDALKKLDPALKLPPTVVDQQTYRLFVDDLWKKYEFPIREEHTGMILPLFYYNTDPNSLHWVVPALITTWKSDEKSSDFFSLPLLSYIGRAPDEDVTTILTPLAYYAKTVRRTRRDYPVAGRNKLSVPERQCAELNDRYALCGLFYRGRFAFNVAKEGLDAKNIEKLRELLLELPRTRKRLDGRHKEIAKQTGLNDRWQTKGEIERLKKLIRYEELKIERAELAKNEAKYQKKVADALKIAASLKLKLDAATLGSTDAAEKAADELLANCTELRSYEDIGNGLFFRKEKFCNGDHRWHFLHILAGGEKSGEKESTHILHLLYRYRREGQRSETIFFPFVSTVRDGEDSRFSFLWRVFSLTKRGGKTGGHILFIPFGEN